MKMAGADLPQTDLVQVNGAGSESVVPVGQGPTTHFQAIWITRLRRARRGP